MARSITAAGQVATLAKVGNTTRAGNEFVSATDSSGKTVMLPALSESEMRQREENRLRQSEQIRKQGGLRIQGMRFVYAGNGAPIHAS